MACTYISRDDAQSFIQDVESMMDDSMQAPSLLKIGANTMSRKNSSRSFKSSVPLIQANNPIELIHLERGGFFIYLNSFI